MQDRFIALSLSARSTLCRVLPAFVLLFAVAMPAGARTRPGHADVLFGDVSIQVFWGLGIGASVDRFDPTADESDGVAEDVFVLQAHALAPPELPIRIHAARVIFQKDSLLVISLDGSRVVGLFTGDARETVRQRIRVALGERSREGQAPEVLLQGGYGLSRHRGAFELPLETWSLPQAPSGVTAQDACDSGGPGATQCDVTCGAIGYGCGVSCQSGYYACCRCGVFVSSCSCVADTSSGGGSGGGSGSGGGDDECTGGGLCPAQCMSCDPNAV